VKLFLRERLAGSPLRQRRSSGQGLLCCVEDCEKRDQPCHLKYLSHHFSKAAQNKFATVVFDGLSAVQHARQTQTADVVQLTEIQDHALVAARKDVVFELRLKAAAADVSSRPMTLTTRPPS
jgi:hypothetical protein